MILACLWAILWATRRFSPCFADFGDRSVIAIDGKAFRYDGVRRGSAASLSMHVRSSGTDVAYGDQRKI